jgi:plasmid stabilization system protein ParE
MRWRMFSASIDGYCPRMRKPCRAQLRQSGGNGQLAISPHIGRPMQDMDLDYRERLIDFGNSSYVALYRVDGETVAILAVRHQKKAGYGQTS